MTTDISRLFLAYLCLLAMAGFIAADMSLPAFPEMTVAFATDSAHIGWSFSAFLLGMALGQPLHGYLADHIGRRRTLLIGLGAFVISTVCCMLTTNVWWLIFWRFFQALGVCAGNVVWQVITIARFTPKTAERVYGVATAGLSVSPALAPVIGGYLNSHFGFEAIFVVLLGLGGLLLLSSVYGLEKDSERVSFEFTSVIAKYRTVLGSTSFWCTVLHLSCATSIYFVYLTGSPFVLSELGYSSTEIGYSYIPQTVMFMLGCMSASRINRHLGLQRVLWLHLAWTVLSVVAIAVAYEAGHLNGMTLILLFATFAFANGLTQPILMSLCVGYFKQLAGIAAGLAGSVQSLIFFVASSIAAALIHYGVAALIGCMFTLSLLLWLIVVCGRERILQLQQAETK